MSEEVVMSNMESRLSLDMKLKNNVSNGESACNDEFLLNPENNRLTVYPIKNESIWKAYKQQQACFCKTKTKSGQRSATEKINSGPPQITQEWGDVVGRLFVSHGLVVLRSFCEL